MTHEFKQGDEVEFLIDVLLPETNWKKGTYVGFYAENHIVGFGNESLYWIDNNENIRPAQKRWRAEERGSYYCLDSVFDVTNASEDGGRTDTKRWEVGNYFETREQAQQAIELIKQTLKKFHDELTK